MAQSVNVRRWGLTLFFRRGVLIADSFYFFTRCRWRCAAGVRSTVVAQSVNVRRWGLTLFFRRVFLIADSF